MLFQRRYSRRAIAMITSGAAIVALALVAVPGVIAANAASVSQTFDYSDSVQTFTVPDGITRLNVSLLGGEGGLGGADNTGPIQGGYRGNVSGILTVNPGDVISVGVGHGGGEGQSRLGSAAGGNGGYNPIGGYSGGTGGVAGREGSSGGGGGGGAATIIQNGSTTIVAGGGGGGGGSGQFGPTAGQPAAATFTARTDAVDTAGQNGISTDSVCVEGIRCDGGASGAGGGGAVGGGPGEVAYGAGSSTEYFGYGGSPGANDASGLTSGTTVYQYYATDGADGSVTISYDMSAPDAPTGVSGTPIDAAANVTWLAPLSSGGATITKYLVQYAIADPSPSWQTFADDTSGALATQVTGLTNGIAYEFRIAAVNSFGSSEYSAPSASVTPSAVPSAPTLTSLTPFDSAIAVAFTAATSDAPITSYQYRITGGDWVTVGTSSPFSIGGLSNGAPYSVVLRAVNAVGSGTFSAPLSATPVSTPSAPTITAISTGIGTASISFTAGNAGGSPITGYQYRLGTGDWTSTGSTSTPFSITGLANGTSFSVTLRAVSVTGEGAVSGASTFATPAAPSAPDITGISVGDGSLDVTFTAGNSGGLAITAYEYQLTSGGNWIAAPSSSSPLVISNLTNGTTYPVRLRAINAVGTGSASDATSATPITSPGAPVLLAGSIAGGNQELDATFTAPTSDGGSAITGYEYSTDGGLNWRTRATGTTESPLVITTLSADGITTLVNGTEYSVEVRAVNSAGSGTSSGVAEGIARTSPDAPTVTSVNSLPKALRVDFAAAANGGSPITAYQYRLNGSTWTNTGSLSTEFTISNLIDGTTYSVEVHAVNAVGASSTSAAGHGTPASQPGRASIGTVTASDRSLAVSVSVSSTGGSAMTAWQYSTDAGDHWATAAGSSSPITISTLSSDAGTRLTNGVSYGIEVRAVNAVGKGAASDSQQGIPLTTPAAPTVTLTPRDGGIGVSYVAGDLGGSSITAAEYTTNDHDWVSVGSLSSSFVIGSLINGTHYGVRVRLVNGAGSGDASDSQSATPRTAPAAPVGVTASPDGGQANVAWQAPGDDGGASISGYVATAWSDASGGSVIGTCFTADLNCVISGLENGTVYFVSVVATNAAGDGSASSPRVAVVPLAKPSAPTIVSIGTANTFLTVNFDAGSEGSSSIAGYEYSLNSGDWISVGTTVSPIIISGLTNGVTYSVVLRAVNSSGAGASSDPVSGTPFGVPDVPDASLITATGGDSSALVNWVAPADNGSSIWWYNVVAWSASIQGSQVRTCVTGNTSCAIGGLNNGQTYYITVDATNAAGTTTRSTPRVAVTPGTPGAVSDLTGSALDGEVDLSWTAADPGLTPATDYTIWYEAAGADSYTQFDDGVSTDTAAAVTGLDNGTAYTFIVYPINDYGTGQASPVSDVYTPLGDAPRASAEVLESTDGGFLAELVNPVSTNEYAVSSDLGSASIQGGLITVTGLDAGQTATVTITVTAFGRKTGHYSFEGTALLAGSIPELTTPVRTVDGYTVDISNLTDGVAYSVSATTGNATIDGSTVTVSGLSSGESSDITVTASQDGYTTSHVYATGAALDAGVAPVLSDPTATADGYVLTISNWSEDYAYTYAATEGSVNGAGSTITVTGLDASQPSTVTVTATRTGYTTTTTDATGAALDPAADLTTTDTTPTADGFTFGLTNYDPTFTWEVTTTAGNVVFADGTVTVTGLEPGTTAIVTLSATKTGAVDASGTVDGTPAIAAGTAPTLSDPVSTAHGFTTTITNYSLLSAYALSVDAGHVVRVGDLVTVSGLDAGASASVTVTVARVGYTSESATALGTALAVVPDPTPTPTPTHTSTHTPTPTVTPTPTPSPTSDSTPGNGGVTAPDGTVSKEIDPGTGESWTGDTLTPSMLTLSPSSTTVSSGGQSMVLSSILNKSNSALVDGHVVVLPGGALHVGVTGFKPGTPVTVWVFSTPVEVARPNVRVDRTAESQFLLPAEIHVGNHMVVASGTSATGKPVTMKIGFVVSAPGGTASGGAAKPTATLIDTAGSNSGFGAGLGWTVAAVLLIALLGFFFLLAWRRRRRDDDEEKGGAHSA